LLSQCALERTGLRISRDYPGTLDEAVQTALTPPQQHRNAI